MTLQDIVFIQGHEADAYLDIINVQGTEQCVKELSQFDYIGEGREYEGSSFIELVRSVVGSEPWWELHGNYIIHWSNRYQTVGLLKLVENE